MTDRIELLPLPKKTVIDTHLSTGIRVYGYDTEAMQLYGIAMAEHNNAARDAEIEALRVDRDSYYQQSKHNLALADRLAEALREAHPFIGWTGSYDELLAKIYALVNAAPSAPVGVLPECEPPIGYRVKQHTSGNWFYSVGDHSSADYWPSRTRAVFKAWEHRERHLLRLAQQPAAVDGAIDAALSFLGGLQAVGNAKAGEIARGLRALAQQPAAVDGVNWRDMYRLQTAMRYMDNNAQLTKERAYRMADNDVAALELQQEGSDNDR